MGIAKSLRKAGYLNKVSQDLSNLAQYFEEQRKKEEQAKIYNDIYNLYQGWRARQNELSNQQYELKNDAEITNPFMQLDKTQRLGVTTPTLSGLKINQPSQTITEEPIIPQTATREITPAEKYETSKKNLYTFLDELAPKLLNRKLEDKDLARINILTELAKNQTQQLKPEEPTLFDLGEGQTKYAYDKKTGKISVVASNPKNQTTEKIERDEKGNYKIYNVEGQKYYKKLKTDSAGNIIGEELSRIPKEGEGKTTINMPGEYGKLLGELNKGIKKVEALKEKWIKKGDYYYPSPDMSEYYKTDKEGNQLGYTEKEYQAIKEGLKGDYLDSAIQIINEQGLDNAVGIIRGGIQKGKNFDEVMKIFKQANPNLDKEDERILRDYFKLLSL